nr:MAG: hypothetical protein [Microvirus sp.]
MAYRRRRSSYRRRRTYSRAPARYGRSGARPYRSRGRGRYRGRTSRSRQTIRVVIQTPTDMLPARPVAGQSAMARRRARF